MPSQALACVAGGGRLVSIFMRFVEITLCLSGGFAKYWLSNTSIVPVGLLALGRGCGTR